MTLEEHPGVEADPPVAEFPQLSFGRDAKPAAPAGHVRGQVQARCAARAQLRAASGENAATPSRGVTARRLPGPRLGKHCTGSCRSVGADLCGGRGGSGRHSPHGHDKGLSDETRAKKERPASLALPVLSSAWVGGSGA